MHRKLRKPLERRTEILEDGPIEFGHAEALAYASLLTEGTHIRLTGQDTERGTFSNRHLVLHDEKTGLEYAPIQNLSGALAPFEIHNSPLSENACLGFEYGYSTASPESLILWEAQFGDFGNSAQVIVDQFIAAGESKWGQTTRLTLLLPHGYEGSGPEHSSARIERFLQLAAEGNMRLANPTTAAQYFHLLRRQARIAKARPMVVFTPKGLLRLNDASSKLSDLTEGGFQYVIEDPERRRAPRGDQAPRALLRARLLRPQRARPARGRLRRRDRPGRAHLPVPEGAAPGADRQVPERRAGDLVPGGAPEHGLLACDGATDARSAAGGLRAAVRRPPRTREPLRGLPGGSPHRAGADRPDCSDRLIPLRRPLAIAGAVMNAWVLLVEILR